MPAESVAGGDQNGQVAVSSVSSMELLMCPLVEAFLSPLGIKTLKSTELKMVETGSQNSASGLLDIIMKGPTLFLPRDIQTQFLC